MTHLRTLFAAGAAAIALHAAGAQEPAPLDWEIEARHQAASETLERLAFLIGDWEIEARFGAGEDAATTTARMHARWAMGGHAVEAEFFYPPLIEGRPDYYATTLFGARPDGETLRAASTNSLGNRKNLDEVEFAAGLAEDEIAFIQSGELFNDRAGVNRIIFHSISENEFHVRQDASLDGETWDIGSFSYVARRMR